jgi:hypothetical protein
VTGTGRRVSAAAAVPAQDGRRAQFERAAPVAAAWAGAPDVLAGYVLDCLAIEADFPGWRVSVHEHNGYACWVAAGDSGYHPVIRADSPAGLRDALAGFLA